MRRNCKSKRNLQRLALLPLFSAAALLLSVIVAIDTASGASNSPSEVSFTGSIPSWASSGATVGVLEFPDLSNSTVGAAMSMQTVSSTHVSGTSFSVTIPNTPNSNYEFVLDNGQEASSVVSGNFATSANTTGEAGEAATQWTIPAFGAPSAVSPPVSSGVNKSAVATPATAPTEIDGCQVLEYTDLGNKYSVVGQAHTYHNVTGEFTYGNNASSGFSIGESASGDAGSFSGGGTYTADWGFSEGTPILAGSHVTVLAELTYGKFYTWCVLLGFDEYFVIPYNWTGGLEAGAAGSAPDNPSGTCPPATSKKLMPGNMATSMLGSTLSSDTTVSFLGWEFGVSQSWGTDTSMVWTAASNASTTYLCGPGQSEPGGSPIIYDSLG